MYIKTLQQQQKKNTSKTKRRIKLIIAIGLVYLILLKAFNK